MGLASAYGEIEGDPSGGPDAVTVKLALPSNKVSAFVDDWGSGDFPGSTVVVTWSRQLLELLRDALMAAGAGAVGVSMLHGGVEEVKRGEEIRKFQAGESELMLMTSGVGGVGITLNRAVRMVLLQRSWSAVEMKQTIDRVHRIGSTGGTDGTIDVIDYVTPGTIEVMQLDRLEDKERVAQEIVRDAAAMMRFLKGTLK